MATKKKVDDAKQDKADLKFIGKTVSDLRKVVAGWAGDVSRHEDEIKSLVVANLELKKKVKRLETDPLYTVPQQLQKKVTALEAQLLNQSAKIATLAQEVKSKKVGKQLTLSASESEHIAKLTERVEDLETQHSALDTELGELKTSLGEAPANEEEGKAPAVSAETVGEMEKQMTLDDAIKDVEKPS